MANSSHQWRRRRRHFHDQISCYHFRHNRCASLPFFDSVPLLLLCILCCLFVVPTEHWAQQDQGSLPSQQQQQPLAAQFFQPIIAFKAMAKQQQTMFNNGGNSGKIAAAAAATATTTMAGVSRYDPTLKAKSSVGYLSASAGQGAFVRTAPSANAPPLQILVEDKDLLPGMPSAVYHYILTGYGAERFAVDHQGNLYLNVDELDTDITGAATFVLHVMAKEVDTTPQRNSAPISLTVHVLEDDDGFEDNANDNGEEAEQEQGDQRQVGGLTLPQTVYMANVSASARPGQQRVIAQVKARESDSISPVFYRIVEVSDGAANAFRFDHARNELTAIGPLYPGHRYKVVIEARDADGLVGHAVVFVQALPSDQQPSSQNADADALSSSAAGTASLIPNNSGRQQQQFQHQLQPPNAQLLITTSAAAADQFLPPIQSAFMPVANPLPPAAGGAVAAVLPPPSSQQMSSLSQTVPLLPPAAAAVGVGGGDDQQQQVASLIAAPAGGFWKPISSANNKNDSPLLSTTTTTVKPLQSNLMLIHFTTTTTLPPPQPLATTAEFSRSNHPQEQTLFAELSESAPIGSVVTSLGNEYSAGRVYFVLANDGGNNAMPMFGIEDEQQMGTVVTKGMLDREQTDHYTLRIEARSRPPIDQLLYVTVLNVNVLDTNDNAPQFVGRHPIQFDIQLDESSLNSSESMQANMNAVLGRVFVRDPDQGQNGNVTLSVMPPLDRLFTINNSGELRVNGALSAAHLGEHQLTLRAMDSGEPPLESRTVVSVRIDGRFVSPTRETLLRLGAGPPRPSPLGTLMTSPSGTAPHQVRLGNNNNGQQQHQQHSSSTLMMPPAAVNGGGQPPRPPAAPLSHLPMGSSASASAFSSSAATDYDNRGGSISGGGDGGESNGGAGGGGQLVPLSSSLIMPSERVGVVHPPPPFTRIDPRLNSALLWAMSTASFTPLSQTMGPPLSKPMPSGGAINLFSPVSSAVGGGTNFGTDAVDDKSGVKPANVVVASSTQPSPTLQPSNSTSKTTIIGHHFGSGASSEELFNNRRPRLAPVFDSAELKVFVEENEGQMELTRLHAHYPDGGPGPITYTLRAGDQSIFSVNPTSGKVMLLRALDAESEPNQQPPVYRLKVGTAEQERTAQFVMEPELAHTCDMIIHVVDINDWIPNFAQEKYDFKIAENAFNGTMVGQVVAFDQDLTPPNNKIRYVLEPLRSATAADDHLVMDNNPFQIDAENGQIVMTNAQRLVNLAAHAHQMPTTLRFVARAIDGGLEGTEQSGKARVDIVVVPREGRPESETAATTTTTTAEERMTSVVPENILIVEGTEDEEEEEEEEDEGTTTTKVAAVWRPTSASLESRTISTTTTAHPLASAANSRPMSAGLTQPMQFVARTYSAAVAEGKRPPVLVQTLETVNKPSDTRFTICAIRKGNIRGPFSVTPNGQGNCELRTQMLLDRESVANYRLNVSIQNGVQTDWAIVTVSVLDANDNRPKFVVVPEADDTDDGTTTMVAQMEAGGAIATVPSLSSSSSPILYYFAVLPQETEAGQQFFTLTVRDADTVESGNGLITYALEEDQVPPPPPSEATDAALEDGDGTSDTNFFGINATTGALFSRKRASEVAQLMRRDFFRLTASACDNPLDGATQQRLCSRVTVAISLLTDRHKFILLFAGADAAEQLRHNEKVRGDDGSRQKSVAAAIRITKKIVKALQNFTAPCPTVKLAAIEARQQPRHNNAEDDDNDDGIEQQQQQQQLLTSATMYAFDFAEQKLCQTHEFQTLFTGAAKQQLASTMRDWGVDLLDVFSAGLEDGRTARSGGHGSGTASVGDGIAALLFPVDWNGTSTMLITIAFAVALIALVGLCALFIFRARHHQQMRRRAQVSRPDQQMRRRRGFSAGDGLLTLSNMKSVSEGGCLFSGLPSYCAGSSNSNNNGGGGIGINSANNLYLPNTLLGCVSGQATVGIGGGGGVVGPSARCPFERGNKFYESQLLELPMGDDNFINSATNPAFGATAHANGMRCIGSRGTAAGGGAVHHDDNCTRGGAANGAAAKKVFRANAAASASNGSPPHRQLLHRHSPTIHCHQQVASNNQQPQLNNRRKPRATSSVPADCFQRHYSPSDHHPAPNHEGDFSIDESLYATNGQRCIY